MSLPRLNNGLIKARSAHQIRLRMNFFDIATDCDCFVQKRAIVEFEDRQQTTRIDFEVVGFQIVAINNTDFDLGNIESLLG
jgi:hypothetical protein